MTGREHAFANDAAVWRSAFVQAGGLLLLAVVLTAASWLLRPDRLPFLADPAAYELDLAAPLVSVKQALVLYEEGDHLFIDTREAVADPREIPGSFRIRAYSLDDDLRRLLDVVYPEDPLILYGSGDLLQISSVAARLAERGFTDVQILGGGVRAWQAAGGELSPREAAPGGDDDADAR